MSAKLIGTARTILHPVALPSAEEVANAVRVLNDQELTVYQLLFGNGLTEPGGWERPGKFIVRREVYSTGITTLVCVTLSGHNDYSFLVRGPDGVLAKVKAILAAVKEGRTKCDVRACCPLAEFRPCVCIVSFSCPLHGEQCHGTHD